VKLFQCKAGVTRHCVKLFQCKAGVTRHCVKLFQCKAGEAYLSVAGSDDVDVSANNHCYKAGYR